MLMMSILFHNSVALKIVTEVANHANQSMQYGVSALWDRVQSKAAWDCNVW